VLNSIMTCMIPSLYRIDSWTWQKTEVYIVHSISFFFFFVCIETATGMYGLVYTSIEVQMWLQECAYTSWCIINVIGSAQIIVLCKILF
jgi:hypothetical protein